MSCQRIGRLRPSLQAVGLIALCGAVALVGCGDDESTASGTPGSSGSGGSGSGASGSGAGSTTSGGGGACGSWLVTYDLTGSTFFIDATADFTITVGEPYSDDDKMGPGTMVLRFLDDGGAPAPGTATIVDYSLTQNFTTGISLASVSTALETMASDECGVAMGSFDATTIAWMPTEMAPYCRDGQISCTGGLCGQFGSPPENQPIVFDMDCSEPHPLATFTFSDGVDAFTADPVVVAMDSNQTSTMTFVGTQTSMTMDPATPACACP